MPYRVKLPPEDDLGELLSGRLPSLPKSGDGGDGGDRADATAPLEARGVPAPSVCPCLPKGVRLVRYKPRVPPVDIRLVSVVSDVDKFIRHYLEELDARLHSPVQIRGGGSVFEILSKLAEAGLELAIEPPPQGQP
jgi:hypothetical protein